MTCVHEGELRAYLDGELTFDAREQVTRHVSGCAPCRQRLAQLERAAECTGARLAALSPRSEADVRRALCDARARVHDQGSVRHNIMRRVLMGGNRVRAWRPVAAGLLVLAMLVAVFSFAPTRAVARQLLSVFRVRRFAVIQVNPDQARIEQAAGALQDKLSMLQPQMIVDEPVRQVGSLEEARSAAGFDVRVPTNLSSNEPITFTVKGRTEFALRLQRDALTTLLTLADMDPNLIPASFTEASITATVPAVVHIQHGKLELTEVRDPALDYPDDLDPRIIGEASLRILGLEPAEARRISETIDWTNTVLLPIPANIAEFREGTVAGVDAVLLSQRSAEGSDYRAGAAVVWEKDGVVYMISAPASFDTLVQLAESMF